MSKPNVILDARVSTPGQAENGYSLDQQIESLRQYAAEHELDVLEELRDAGYSGATLNRPGIDHILEVVAGGGVDAVLAQDADRITREPWHFGYLKAEFERYGTKLRALGAGPRSSSTGAPSRIWSASPGPRRPTSARMAKVQPDGRLGRQRGHLPQDIHRGARELRGDLRQHAGLRIGKGDRARQGGRRHGDRAAASDARSGRTGRHFA